MTRDPFSDAVRHFHEICELPLDEPITDSKLIDARLTLLREEVTEVAEAAQTASASPSPANRAALLRELADVQYVLAGSAVSFGLPIAEAFARVDKANHSKLVNGKAVKGENGKVIKGPDFAPPVMDDLVADMVS